MKKYLPIGRTLVKPLRLKIIGPWLIELDRNEQIIKIQADPNEKLKPFEYRYELYLPEEWLKIANELFRGQPLVICEDQIVSYLSIMI